MADDKQPEALRLADYLQQEWVTGDCLNAASTLRRLHIENETMRAGYDAARLEIASLQAANLELETLCDATYVEQGADAYHHACEELERHQALRAKAGKELGTTRSLCDGMSWLYEHIAGLEAQLEAVGAGGVSQLVPTQEPMFWVRLLQDGLYQGPIHNAKFKSDRSDMAGSWSPLYPHPAPQPVAQAAECGNCFEGKSDMDHDCRKCGGAGAVQPAAQALDAARYQFLRDDEWRQWLKPTR